MNDDKSDGVVVYRSIAEKNADEAYHKVLAEHPEAALAVMAVITLVIGVMFFRTCRKAKRNP